MRKWEFISKEFNKLGLHEAGLVAKWFDDFMMQKYPHHVPLLPETMARFYGCKDPLDALQDIMCHSSTCDACYHHNIACHECLFADVFGLCDSNKGWLGQLHSHVELVMIQWSSFAQNVKQ